MVTFDCVLLIMPVVFFKFGLEYPIEVKYTGSCVEDIYLIAIKKGELVLADPSTVLTLVVATSFCISILCSLAKSAQVNFSPTKLETMLGSDRASKKLRQFISCGSQVLIALTIFGTLGNMAFVGAIILSFAKNGSISNEMLIYGIILSFCPLLVFAKAVPETLARLQPEKFMIWLMPFSKVVYWVLFWVVSPVYWFSKRCEKSLGEMSPSALAAAYEKELLNVVSAGQKEGVLEEVEKEMITGIMELKDSEVKEVMTPRTDMISIPLDTSIEKTISLANEKGHSRIPVHRENRDDIVGILYVKDLLKYWDDDQRQSLKIEDLIRKPYFVPETKLIGSLLQDFQKQKLHIATVLDEYGGTSGIVTIEDIIEEIVGEILDEYDAETYEPIREIGENEIEVDARVHVDELNEKLDIELPVDNGYETVGGFLFTFIGHIPKKDESCVYQDVRFVILDATERRINRIKVIKN